MLEEQALFIIYVHFSYGDAAVIYFSLCFPLNILAVTKSKIDKLPRMDIRHIFTFQKIHLLKKTLDQTHSCLITHSTLLNGRVQVLLHDIRCSYPESYITEHTLHNYANNAMENSPSQQNDSHSACE